MTGMTLPRPDDTPPRILLVTLNARYSHASFGLRCLRANLGPFREGALLREFTIHQPRGEIVEAILADEPDLVGFGVYIWNVAETTEIVRTLRVLRPDLTIVIGGPEVSYEYEETGIFAACDHLVRGEGDIAFRELVAELAAGGTPPKVIEAQLPDVSALALPYAEYTDEDLARRIVYVEASRGCPFRCEFCLSSLEIPVRAFPLDSFLASLQQLLDRGARGLKFVDRTFNLNVKFSLAILEFLLARYREGLELHFEMIPDRLPTELRDVIRRFPPGAVQFEVGVQTLTDEVSHRISRRQNVARMEENLRFLREETGVHVHADLILGLPGETLESMADSFDRLYRMRPGEIQVGILKRLRGTPIERHSEVWEMRYSPYPPYEILASKTLPFPLLQRLKRFARYFDLFYNKGNFVESMQALMEPVVAGEGPAGKAGSPFGNFLAFSDWVWKETAQTHEIALARQYRLVFGFLHGVLDIPEEVAAERLLRDWDRWQVRKERPEFLKPWVASLHPPAAPIGGARWGH